MVVYIIAWSKLNHETHFSPERQVCDEKDLKLKKLSIYNVKVIISCSSISDLLRIKALFFLKFLLCSVFFFLLPVFLL